MKFFYVELMADARYPVDHHETWIGIDSLDFGRLHSQHRKEILIKPRLFFYWKSVLWLHATSSRHHMRSAAKVMQSSVC